MARFVTGNTFGTTDTVTAAKLNTAVNDAKISTDSVDNNTIELNSDALRLKDSSSKTTGVTFAKMQHISTAKVLGRASASEGDVEEAFDFKDEDNMSSDSATALASQQSIKAFVDNLIGTADKSSASGLVAEGDQGSLTLGGGLIIKFGTVDVNSATVAFTFKDSSGSASPFPNGIYGVHATVNESIGSASETCSVTLPTVNGCSITGYQGVSGAAVGRVFFIAYGY